MSTSSGNSDSSGYTSCRFHEPWGLAVAWLPSILSLAYNNVILDDQTGSHHSGSTLMLSMM
ncbi:MAG: hypothetical protein R3B47_19280 [Bacteroidia bacterium]